jgi:calcineurin-like phosphoesterase
VRQELEPPVLVHYLGGGCYEHRLLGLAARDGVAAVIGTWAHAARDDVEVLPGGVAVVGDVGYTGPAGGIGGFEPDHFVALYRGDPAPTRPYALTSGKIRMDAVAVDIGDDGPRHRDVAAGP